MSPTVFRAKGFRFFFFSREEARIHVHAQSSEKFWLDPEIELAVTYRLNDRDLRTIEELIKERESDIRAAWHEHFGS